VKINEGNVTAATLRCCMMASAFWPAV